MEAKINLSKDVKKSVYNLLKTKANNMYLAELINWGEFLYGVALLNAYRANGKFKMHSQIFEHAIDFSNRAVKEKSFFREWDQKNENNLYNPLRYKEDFEKANRNLETAMFHGEVMEFNYIFKPGIYLVDNRKFAFQASNEFLMTECFQLPIDNSIICRN